MQERLLASEQLRQADHLMMVGRLAAGIAHELETPVILITAFGDDETHTEARRLGAAAVFNKPFEFDDLRTVVLNLTKT
jgi:DNA-binding response OmpR family regulator